MIFTECIYCGESIITNLEEDYLNLLKKGKQLIERYICEKCGRTNYIEHKRVGGETFGKHDKRAKKLVKFLKGKK